MVEISIIIPVYNVKNYLKKCLDSVLAQTFQNFEVLLVDDGSSDGTEKICDEYAAMDARIHVTHKENGGVSEARNLALRQAKGKFFLFFDGDDYVLPECLEELYYVAEEKKVDAVLYGYYLVENDQIIETHLPVFEKDYFQGTEIMEKVIPRFIGVSYQDIYRWMQGDSNALKKENTALWRSMVRGDLIRNNQILFDKTLKVGEDTCFTTTYLSYAQNCQIVNKCYYHLVVRSTSTIFVYEKSPVEMIRGKIALLSARRKLTDEINQRKNVHMDELWYGTVVMSCIQMAFKLSGAKGNSGFFKRFQYLKEYIRQEETQKAIKQFEIPKAGGIKRVPFLLLKSKCYFLLYFCTYILDLMHYEFQR